MNSTHALSGVQPPSLTDEHLSRTVPLAFPALRRSYRLAAATAPRRSALALDTGSSGMGRDGAPMAGLERATWPFRFVREGRYRANAARARAVLKQLRELYRSWVSVGVSDFDALTKQTRELEARAKWHERRAGAQRPRFDTVRACRSATLHVTCRSCTSELCPPVPCACGVVRVCDECAAAVAAKRQKRIAAARVDAMAGAGELGLFDGARWGGAFSEKMLTLTVPHFEREDATGEVLEATEDFGLQNTVAARLAALRLAWPRLLRRIRSWVAGRGRAGERRNGEPHDAKSLAFYRLLEWTRGHDGKGHPHFHVYAFSPWLPINLIRRWWAEALQRVGVPLPHSCALCRDGGETCVFGLDAPHVIVDLRRLDGFNWAALKELIKSGDRRAIESRLGVMKTPGLDAITYASAWTMSDAFDRAELLEQLPDAAALDVQRDLYCALEGRRLAQGSRGFLLAPAIPVCACCGDTHFLAAVVLGFESCETAPETAHEERGPPHERDDEHRDDERDERRRSGAAA